MLWKNSQDGNTGRSNPISRVNLGISLVLGLFMSVWAAIPACAVDLTREVLIEAAAGVDYDMEKNITTATQNVKLTRGEIIVYADRVTYFGNTGVVEAVGHVRLQNPSGEYRTENLRYNVFDSTGSLQAFTATLNGNPRDFQFKGQGIELQAAQSRVAQVAVTRCPKAKPDYTLNAKWVKIAGKKVQLKNVILKAKGVPVFYFPFLSFYTDQGMPELEPGFDKSDGVKLKGNWVIYTSEKSEWMFKGDISWRGEDSTLGVGNTTRFKDSNNQLDIMYNLDGWWKLTDTYTYDTHWLKVVADGFYNFSDDKRNEMGIRLTRKYWTTPVGEWQLGVLARRLKAVEGQNLDPEYGGTYTGIQLDYRINSNFKLSYLELGTVSGEDFRGLLEDFGLGSNALYEVNLPLKEGISMKFDGTYNFEESKWYHQIYSISRDTCCYKPTIFYDRADHSWGGSLRVKF